MAKIVSQVPSQVPSAKEARQHQRVMVPKGTFVIVSPGTDKEWKVQAIDISQGGMAFIYQGSKEDLDTAGVLKILAKDTDLPTVDFETVSDEPAPGCTEPSLPTRRRGVKFKWMGVVNKKDLSDFVNNISP
jgi:c-di-GMP-binding flagellar brake protein YcgR